MNTLDDVLPAAAVIAPVPYRRLRASPADARRACAVPPLPAAVIVQPSAAGPRAKSPDGAAPVGVVPVNAVPVRGVP
ncbi:hypothetical protein OG979_29570 [Actinomadura citrea]|uniref:hypothetical protein n=1 Tax=Actinomadura citrea TaxID=46158 RepID=UPI002E2B92F6|nr:hypothetical protein [Actinomadura citrea]